MKNVSVIPLNKTNFSEFDFHKFFSDYKNERFYQETLRIDPKVFVSFQVDKLNNSVQNERAKFWIAVNHNDEVVSVFGVNKDYSQSTLYGKEIHIISPFYNFKKEHSIAFPLIAEEIEKYRKEVNADTLRIKIRTIDHSNITDFEDEHYHYYASADKVFFDIRKIKSSPFYDSKIDSLRTFETRRLSIRKFVPEDIDKCLKLIEQHQKNEKFYNKNLDLTKTQQLFKTWFINKTNDENFKVNLLIDNKHNKIAGLTVFFKPEFFNKYLSGQTLYSPDLIILDEVYKRTGAAYLIISSLINELRVSVEGQTMADNFELQAFVTRIGFVVVDSFVFLEKNFKRN